LDRLEIKWYICVLIGLPPVGLRFSVSDFVL
jgi:hypothetical protein